MTSTAQSNYRNLHFGIDNGHLGSWTDCGRPGQAVKISALSTLGGNLYAGTFENGKEEVGHLWRYEGEKRWTDLGNPVGCNSVNAVVEFQGALYCALGRYNSSGSAMGDPLNTTPGGQVYRVDADGQWTFCGHPGIEDATPEEIPTTGHNTGKADNATALTVYQGRLYATSLYREGAFVYDGGTSWTPIGPDVRLMSFTVYRDRLYTLVNGGPVLRYEGGTEWTDYGCPETSTQTYSAVTFKGELYVGTWPQGEVYRYDGNTTWTCLGRTGYEREIMAMGLYNGKVYIGSLPMANVWRMDGNQFTFLESLDSTSAPLRRVWSMAVYQGRLYAGTLPSGHVYSVEAGKVATWDRTFPEGWRHIAAVKQGGVLTLYRRWNSCRYNRQLQSKTLRPQLQLSSLNRLWRPRLFQRRATRYPYLSPGPHTRGNPELRQGLTWTSISLGFRLLMFVGLHTLVSRHGVLPSSFQLFQGRLYAGRVVRRDRCSGRTGRLVCRLWRGVLDCPHGPRPLFYTSSAGCGPGVALCLRKGSTRFGRQ